MIHFLPIRGEIIILSLYTCESFSKFCPDNITDNWKLHQLLFSLAEDLHQNIVGQQNMLLRYSVLREHVQLNFFFVGWESVLWGRAERIAFFWGSHYARSEVSIITTLRRCFLHMQRTRQYSTLSLESSCQHKNPLKTNASTFIINYPQIMDWKFFKTIFT